jgi:hypothetical protein
MEPRRPLPNITSNCPNSGHYPYSAEEEVMFKKRRKSKQNPPTKSPIKEENQTKTKSPNKVLQKRRKPNQNKIPRKLINRGPTNPAVGHPLRPLLCQIQPQNPFLMP